MKELDWEFLINRYNKGFNDQVGCVCPICEAVLSVHITIILCKNRCFIFNVSTLTFNTIIIYEKHFHYLHGSSSKDTIKANKEVIVNIKNKIKYWKKDYRYVAEILERS